MLVGASKKGSNYDPRNALETALDRMREVKADGGGVVFAISRIGKKLLEKAAPADAPSILTKRNCQCRNESEIWHQSAPCSRSARRPRSISARVPDGPLRESSAIHSAMASCKLASASRCVQPSAMQPGRSWANGKKAAAVLFREGKNLDAVVICGSHGDTIHM